MVPLMLVLTGICFGGLALMFYSAFPNSHHLFGLKHQYLPHLDLHTDAWRFEAGETISLYISSIGANRADAWLYDILQRDTIVQKQGMPVEVQPVHDSVSVVGSGWKQSAQIRLPNSTPSGWYVLELKTKAARTACSLFITPADSVQKPVAMLLSTNTWNAYNFWGGQSLYTGNKTHTVSFDRPQPLSDPFLENSLAHHQIYYQSARKDRFVAEWLHSEGYAFDAYPMDELHESIDRLQQYPAIVISTHSEYWSAEMLKHLNAYLEQGGALMCLSGNTAAYVSELNQRRLTVYKEEQNLWFHADTARLRPFGTANNLSSFHTYAPYRVETDSSWILAGTGLRKGDLFGMKSETYDYTYMYNGWLKNLLGALRNRYKWGAASGLEVDQVFRLSPENWVTIARGLNPNHVGHGEVYPQKWDWNAEGGADLGYYRHPGGGLVFNVNSLAFTGAIPHDAEIRRMLGNVMREMVREK